MMQPILHHHSKATRRLVHSTLLGAGDSKSNTRCYVPYKWMLYKVKSPITNIFIAMVQSMMRKIEQVIL